MQSMETVSESGTWCLILWNKRVNSFGNSIITAAQVHAQTAYPDECIGFVVASPCNIDLLPIPAQATSTNADVDPADVVHLAYNLAAQGREVIATYHSHPSGTVRPSRKDDVLSLWSSMLVLIVRERTVWVPIVYQWSTDDCNLL